MREYETTFIIQPEITDEGIQAICGRLEGILEPLTLPLRGPGQGAALPDDGPWGALSTVRGDPATLALLRNPAAWLEVPLLRPLLGQVALLGPGAGPIPALVAAARVAAAPAEKAEAA